jgi:hypothetical protein
MATSTTTRLRGAKGRQSVLAGLLICVALSGLALDPRPVSGQAWVGVPPRSTTPTASSMLGGGNRDPNAQMLVQATEMRYDYRSERVVAVGHVQLHYAGSVLEADKVTYDQRTKRLYAEGNVRLTEADGKIVNAERLDLDENFRNGFVDSLHVETSDKLRMAASRADVRSKDGEDRLTVFQAGVYTACEPCKDEPSRPPKWQVKAARIIHDEGEKTIYFEDARLEVYGIPVAYFPYFWTPDPTVKRKTGFLRPAILTSTYYGFGFQAPFFWNLAPNYDVTFAPIMTTKQGPIALAEWRHRVEDGAYSIKASGLFQQDRQLIRNRDGVELVLGLGREPVHRQCLRPAIQGDEAGPGGGLADLSVRPRRQQLFRCPRDPFLRAVADRRAEAARLGASARGLQVQVQGPDIRRRALLQRQPDQHLAPAGRLRSDPCERRGHDKRPAARHPEQHQPGDDRRPQRLR